MFVFISYVQGVWMVNDESVAVRKMTHNLAMFHFRYTKAYPYIARYLFIYLFIYLFMFKYKKMLEMAHLRFRNIKIETKA